MTAPSKLSDYNHAQDPARRLLERLSELDVRVARGAGGRAWRGTRGAAEGPAEGRARAAERADDGRAGGQVIFDLERVDATGMARNQVVDEYLTYGIPLIVDGLRGRDKSEG